MMSEYVRALSDMTVVEKFQAQRQSSRGKKRKA
jgi:hypothetical protein